MESLKALILKVVRTCVLNFIPVCLDFYEISHLGNHKPLTIVAYACNIRRYIQLIKNEQTAQVDDCIILLNFIKSRPETDQKCK